MWSCDNCGIWVKNKRTAADPMLTWGEPAQPWKLFLCFPSLETSSLALKKKALKGCGRALSPSSNRGGKRLALCSCAVISSWTFLPLGKQKPCVSLAFLLNRQGFACGVDTCLQAFQGEGSPRFGFCLFSRKAASQSLTVHPLSDFPESDGAPLSDFLWIMPSLATDSFFAIKM